MLPSAEDFSSYVTWPVLEDALKGVRSDMKELYASKPLVEAEVRQITIYKMQSKIFHCIKYKLHVCMQRALYVLVNLDNTVLDTNYKMLA